jgi:hypothetical protein
MEAFEIVVGRSGAQGLAERRVSCGHDGVSSAVLEGAAKRSVVMKRRNNEDAQGFRNGQAMPPV